VRKSSNATTIGLAIVVALAGRAVGGVWLTRPEVPRDLQKAQALTLVPVSQRTYDDGRTVTVTVTAQEGQKLTAPRGGRTSALTCTAGGTVTSGTSVLALDGAGLLSLATSVPPWRDLTVGDTGPDAAALNAELARLGHSVAKTDRITPATVRAYRAAARQASAEQPRNEVIQADQILWIPAPEVVVASCPVRLGDRVATSDPVLTLQSTTSARIPSLPADAVAGGRVVTIDSDTIPVTDDGQITDATALTTLLASSAYATTSANASGTRQLSARWVLAEPATIMAVPPAAIAGTGTDAVCVVDEKNTVYPVRVVGSQLGQTFILPKGETKIPGQVLATPNASTRCE